MSYTYLMYEHHREQLLPRRLFVRRLIAHIFFGCAIVLASLIAGILGYHIFEGFSWIDSLLNAAMILSGMGEVGELKTHAGKLFASFYALFSGVAFISTVGLIFAPVVHRFMHKFHLKND